MNSHRIFKHTSDENGNTKRFGNYYEYLYTAWDAQNVSFAVYKCIYGDKVLMMNASDFHRMHEKAELPADYTAEDTVKYAIVIK